MVFSHDLSYYPPYSLVELVKNMKNLKQRHELRQEYEYNNQVQYCILC